MRDKRHYVWNHVWVNFIFAHPVAKINRNHSTTTTTTTHQSNTIRTHTPQEWSWGNITWWRPMPLIWQLSSEIWASGIWSSLFLVPMNGNITFCFFASQFRGYNFSCSYSLPVTSACIVSPLFFFRIQLCMLFSVLNIIGLNITNIISLTKMDLNWHARYITDSSTLGQ